VGGTAGVNVPGWAGLDARPRRSRTAAGPGSPGTAGVVGFCYHAPANLNVRDLPDELHAVLVHRASARGMSLRAYVVEVLTAHCPPWRSGSATWTGCRRLGTGGRGRRRSVRPGRTGMRTWRASSLVVDASAIVELLRRTTAGRQVARRLQGAALAAPAHLDAEVLSALARLARDNPADEPLVGPRLALLARAPIQRYPCPPLLIEAWEMRANVAVRDALYVALSRRLGAPLLTADHRLARSTAGMAGVVVQTV